jgi:hypothetical protein
MAGDHHADDRDKYQRHLTALEHKLVEHEPVWLRDGTDESRWQVIIALAIIMALQFLMDGTYFPVALRPLLVLEGLLLALLLAINIDGLRRRPKPFGKNEKFFLAGLLFLIAASGVATALLLDWKIIQRQKLPDEIGGVVSDNSSILLLSGALIIVTNIVVFGILYWLIDLGGPQKRAGKRGAKLVIQTSCSRSRTWNTRTIGSHGSWTIGTSATPTSSRSHRPMPCPSRDLQRP